MDYEMINVCQNSCMLFGKEHKEENKFLKCGKPRYIDVINDDGEMVTTEIAHKQLRYMPITPQLKKNVSLEKNRNLYAVSQRW
jgi:hypothetical protein